MEQDWQLTEMFTERGVSGPMPSAERPGATGCRSNWGGDRVMSPKLDQVFRSNLYALQTNQ